MQFILDILASGKKYARPQEADERTGDREMVPPREEVKPEKTEKTYLLVTLLTMPTTTRRPARAAITKLGPMLQRLLSAVFLNVSLMYHKFGDL